MFWHYQDRLLNSIMYSNGFGVINSQLWPSVSICTDSSTRMYSNDSVVIGSHFWPSLSIGTEQYNVLK